jgi:hypothetical protein
MHAAVFYFSIHFILIRKMELHIESIRTKIDIHTVSVRPTCTVVPFPDRNLKPDTMQYHLFLLLFVNGNTTKVLAANFIWMILTDIVPPFLIISPTLLLGFNSVVSALLGPRAPNRTWFASKKKNTVIGHQNSSSTVCQKSKHLVLM